jgi:hypothetical protein
MPKALVRSSYAALLLVLGIPMESPVFAGPAQYVFGNFNRCGVTVFSSASEPSVAVGPYQILTQAQGGVAAFTKDGTQVGAFLENGVPSFSSNPDLFYGLIGPIDPGTGQPTFRVDAAPFGSPYPGGTAGTCDNSPVCSAPARDPRMMFDPVAQRFYALGWSYTHLNLNVSRSADLQDGWYNYHINLDRLHNIFDYGSLFWDQPSIGFSTDKIVIAAWTANNEILVLDKAALLSGSVAQTPHTFTYDAQHSYGTHLDISNTAVTYKSVDSKWTRVCANLSTNSPDVYMLRRVFDSGLYRFQVATVSGNAATPSVTVATTPQAFELRPVVLPADTPGGPLAVACVEEVLLSSPFFRDGVITVATFQGNGYPGISYANELRIFELTAPNWAVTTDETYGASTVDHAFPSAVRDAQGNLYVGFNKSSATEYPSAYVTARRVGETTLETATQVKLGDNEAIPYTDCEHLDKRWGDFTGIALDEYTGTAYFAGQYTSSQSHSLASWVTSFHFPSSTPSACTTDGTWQKISFSGVSGSPLDICAPPNPNSAPDVRSGATMTWDPGHNRFILFGGYKRVNGVDYYYRDTWSYSPASGAWTYMFDADVGRANHSAVYVPGVPNRLVIFGGENQDGRRNDTRALDLTNPIPPGWTTLSTSGTPSARASHVAICDPTRNQMIVFGGAPWSPGTWKLSFANNTWTQISPSLPPGEFEGCSGIYDAIGDRMVIFGGRLYVSASCPNPWLINSNATYSLSLANPTQWNMHAITNPPPPRAFAAAVYDPVYRRMIVHGGIQDQVCSGSGPPECGQTLENGLSDTYALKLESMTWYPVGSFGNDVPIPRGRHSAGYALSSNKIFVFGGAERRAAGNALFAPPATCATTWYHDLWSLTLPDVSAPSAVIIAVGLGSDGGTITWNAPGDDGSTGTACAYDLRYSTSTITAANFNNATPIPTTPPQVAGSPESAEVTDLNGCSWYSFALKTRDGNGHWSALSNTPKRQTMCFITGGTDTTSDSQEGGALPVAVDLRLASAHPAQSDLKISYAIPAQGRGSVLNLSVYDLIGRRIHTLIDGKAEPGLHLMTWDLRDRQGARVKNGIYFLKLRVGDEVRQQKVMVVE